MRIRMEEEDRLQRQQADSMRLVVGGRELGKDGKLTRHKHELNFKLNTSTSEIDTHPSRYIVE